jgi:hypothetical protein
MAAGLARADRGEQPRDDDGQPAFLGRQRQGRRSTCCTHTPSGVSASGPARIGILVKRAAVSFVTSDVEKITVNRLLGGVLQDNLGAPDVCLNRAHRRFDNELHAHGRGEVEHDVGRSMSSAVSDSLAIESITYSKPGLFFRCAMLSIDPVERSSITMTWWPAATNASAVHQRIRRRR